jgi:hypothetical protein
MVVLDITDATSPREISTLRWSPGGDTHTCLPLPGRSLVVTTDEAVKEECAEEEELVRVIDVSDVRAPVVVGSARRRTATSAGRGFASDLTTCMRICREATEARHPCW